MTDKYILVGQTPVPCDNLLEWARWFENTETRVRQSRVGPYTVSTIFLGLNHNFGEGVPLLFETMAWIDQPQTIPATEFDGHRFPETTLPRTFLDIQHRCSTWLEAEAQHQAVIDELKESSDEVEQLFPEVLVSPSLRQP